MIKINKWFPKEIVEIYREEIVSKVIEKNNSNSEFVFLKWENKEYKVGIDDLLTSSLEELRKIEGIELYISLCQQSKNWKEDSLERKKFEGISKNIKNIINYDTLSRKENGRLRHKLMSSLGLTTCPYCNRQYITDYIDENDGVKYENDGVKSTADLDHFYPKKYYPLFALSLFNFIPSCQVCNSRMKLDKWKDILYPHDEGFDDKVKFCLKPKAHNEKDLLKSWLGDGEVIDNLQIDFEFCENLDKEFKKRAEGSIELFKLKQVYDIHKAKALDIILKQRIYLEGSYKEYMSTLMKKLSLSCTDEDIINILVGYHWKDENYDEPLSKLVHDIFYK